MVTTRKMEKENNVQGVVRKAKAAPDFSKLHKQWDAKLQKGKAVKKKPLTEVQPFQLTDFHPTSKSSSSSCSDDDFITTTSAKEKLFDANEVQTVHTSKPKRTTIGVIGRSPAIQKSAIPRPSFGVTKRTSLYAGTQKPRQQNKNVSLKPAITPKNKATPSRLHAKENGSVRKRAQDMQGFTVNFKADFAAFDSIMNGQGIEQLPKTPSKLSSQFGPSKKGRTNPKGRIVPFTKPTGRVKGRAVQLELTQQEKQEQQNRASLNAAKHQRWSIYSRESYSSKPNLLEWLQKLAEESKAKRLAAKQQQQQQKQNADITATTRVTPNKDPVVEAGVSTSQRASFLFRKTLVGYQGDLSKVNTKKNNTKDVTAESKGTVISTPERPLRIAKDNSSTIKSILKKKSGAGLAKIPESPAAVAGTPATKKPDAAKSLRMIEIGTPVRYSAYARQQMKLGLPLPPKENRYEGPGEHIPGPVSTKSNDNEAQGEKSMMVNAKSVRWADNTAQDAGINSPSNSTVRTSAKSLPLQNDVSKEVGPRKAYAKSPANKASEKTTPNNSLQRSPIMTRARSGQQQTPTSVATTTSPRLSPNSFTSHAHQIKYVMPAEQPMERSERLKPRTPRSLLDESNVTMPRSLLHIEDTRALNPTKSKVPTASTKKTLTEVDTAKKSWAQVLEEQLDPYAKTNTTTPLATSQNDVSADQATTKKKKRNKNRLSILERIYGDAINFIGDDGSPDQNQKTEQNQSVTKFTGFGTSRPVPTIDQRLIGDLMSFNDDENSDMELEEPSIFSFFKTVENEGEEKNEENHFQSTLLRTPSESFHLENVELIGLTPVLDTAKKLPEAPCKQSTKARTPYKQEMLDILHRTLADAKKRREQDDTLNCTVLPSADNTMVAEEATILQDATESESGNNNNETTIREQSTPPPLVELKGAQSHPGQTIFSSLSVKDPLTKTEQKISPVSVHKVASREEEKTTVHGVLKPASFVVEPYLNNDHTTIQKQQSTSELTEKIITCNVPNIQSLSMKAFPESNTRRRSCFMPFSSTATKEEETSKHVVQSTVTFAQPSISSHQLVRPASFKIMHRTSPVVSSKVASSIVRPSQLASFALSSSSFPAPPSFSGSSQKPTLTQHANQDKPHINNANKSIFGFPSTATFGGLKGSALLSSGTFPGTPSFNLPSDSDCPAPQVNGNANSSKVFPVAPLFSSFSQGIKFSESRSNIYPPENETKSVLRPSVFSSQATTKTPHSTEEANTSRLTINETTFYNESTLLDSSDVCMIFEKPKNNTESTVTKRAFCLQGGGGGAFRPVKPTMDNGSERITPYEISLNTEVEVYTKVGELYQDRFGDVNNMGVADKRREGAFNVVADLLMYGDSKHFIPIS